MVADWLRSHVITTTYLAVVAVIAALTHTFG